MISYKNTTEHPFLELDVVVYSIVSTRISYVSECQL